MQICLGFVGAVITFAKIADFQLPPPSCSQLVLIGNRSLTNDVLIYDPPTVVLSCMQFRVIAKIFQLGLLKSHESLD